MYKDLQIDWLKSFVAVIDSGSFSAAANHINRSQSAVSMQIKKLEDALDCQLLTRDTRTQQLTFEGEKLLGYARRILDIHNETQTAFHQPKISGHIRLGVPDSYAVRYLTPILKQFAALHSSVEIELICEQSMTLLPKVEARELDLVLISRGKEKKGTFLFYEPMYWVGSKQFNTWKRDPLPIAVYESQSPAKKSAIHSVAQQGRRYKIVYNSTSLSGQIAAVESGIAVAVLPQCSTPEHFQILGHEQGFGPLEPMEVAVVISEAAMTNPAVTTLYQLFIKTLRNSGCNETQTE